MYPSSGNQNVATPEYSPPEQLKNDSQAISAASGWAHDIFSLGVILLEMVLGWPVWLSMNCIVKHINNPKNIIKTVGVFSVPGRDKHKICDRQLSVIKQIDKAFANSMTMTGRDK